MHRSNSASHEEQQVKSCHWEEVNGFRIMKCCDTANAKKHPQTLSRRSIIGDESDDWLLSGHLQWVWDVTPYLFSYFTFATYHKSNIGSVAGTSLLGRVEGHNVWSGMTCWLPRCFSSSVQRICRWGFRSHGFAFC